MIPDWFELRSAGAMVAISGFFMALVMASLAPSARHIPGFRAWLVMAFLLPSGLALNALQGSISPWLAFPIGLTLLNTGVWLAWVGARQFMGRGPLWSLTVAVVIATALCGWYFAIVVPRAGTRVLVVSLMQAWAAGATAWTFWRCRDEDVRFALRFASLPLGLFSVVCIARAIATLSGPLASGFARTPTNTAAVLVGGSAMLCTYTGLVMCINALLTREVRRLADHDTLTGLLNRNGFTRRFTAWRAAFPDGGAVALIDLDHFKHVNDTLGHAEGDQLMVAFSEILKRLIVHPILACRLGGDEFALLSHDVVTLRSLCEACRIEFVRHCDRTYQDALSEPRPRVSAGLTALSADLSTSLRTADVALYRAKTEGRNRLYEWSEA